MHLQYVGSIYFPFVHIIRCIRASYLDINDYIKDYFRPYAYCPAYSRLMIQRQMKRCLLYGHHNP